MLPNDGRVISNFIVQALRGENLTVYGEGLQTRCFCYVDDLIEGILKFMNSDLPGPLNLGNTSEYTILEIAKFIINKINPNLKIEYHSLPKDDPYRRKPVIDLAKEKLDWEPKINLDSGINKTINYFKNIIF